MLPLVSLVVVAFFSGHQVAATPYGGSGFGGHIGSFGHLGGGGGHLGGGGGHLGGVGHLGGGIGHLGGGGGHLGGIGHLGGGGGHLGGGVGHLGGGGGHFGGGQQEYIILADEGIGHGGYGGGGFGGGHIGGGHIGGGHIGGGHIGGGHIGGGHIGGGHIGGIGHGGGFGSGFGGGIGGGGGYIGGEEISHGSFGGGKKNLNNEHFAKSYGSNGGELSHQGGGFSKGEGLAKNVKGESGYFADALGGKNVFQDGKDYHGGHQFTKEVHGGGEQLAKKGHKKGHTVKGFKDSHHKEENGKTEEYYDEEHDEGGNVAFKGEKGGFGEKAGSSFKGGHLDSKFDSGEAKKEGHFGQEYLTDKAEANHGKYGEKKFSGHGGAIGEHKLLGNDDVSGHHESSKSFKHIPIHY